MEKRGRVIRVSEEFFQLLKQYERETGITNHVEATRQLAQLLKKYLREQGKLKPRILLALEELL